MALVEAMEGCHGSQTGMTGFLSGVFGPRTYDLLYLCAFVIF